MLESTHNLLNIEHPLGEGVARTTAIAPSRHELSVGQELRGSYGRFYLGREVGEQLAALSNGVEGRFTFSTEWRAKSWLAFVYEIALTNDTARFSDPSIPEFLRQPEGVTILRAHLIIVSIIYSISTFGER